MMKLLLVVVALANAAAFAPAAPARGVAAAARSDGVVMAAKKKGVNPALFATGIAPKKVARSKSDRDDKTKAEDPALDSELARFRDFFSSESWLILARISRVESGFGSS